MTFEEFREEAKKGLGGVTDTKVKRGIYNIILNRKCRPKEVIDTLVYLGMLDIDTVNLIKEEKQDIQVDLVEVDEVEVVDGKIKEEKPEATVEEEVVTEAPEPEEVQAIAPEVPVEDLTGYKIENPEPVVGQATAPEEIAEEPTDYKIEEMGEAHVAADIPVEEKVSEETAKEEEKPAMVVHDVIHDTATPVSEAERAYMLKEYNIDYNTLNSTALAEIRKNQKEFEKSVNI